MQNGLVSGGLFHGSGCQPYAIEPCEHHTEGDRPPCTGEEGTTPKCSHKCVDGYTGNFAQDKHFGSVAYRFVMQAQEFDQLFCDLEFLRMKRQS